VLNGPSLERLRAGALAVGVTLAPTDSERFGRYYQLLATWSRHINLTRVTRPEDVIDRHFIDCLALAPRLAGGSTLLDVGSGAGFPGVVVALARPDVPVTLCESIGKKVAFLRSLVHQLGLRCEVVDSRSDALVRAGRTFGAVVSRAVAPVPEWTRHAAPLVAAGGELFAMVATPPDDPPTPPGFADPTIHGYTLPDGSPRALLCWRRST
jgi:16S rRNA (guanine527-N7)-methyltransferase